ncbi:TPA: hypothetical protein TXJ06_000432 [Streptococcus suis]|nr:hypothetical protein [Streptococcus suis]HEM2866184.1 hypothetical protein [Streptococcus suis]HEM6342267.1 hypothetical protein [Streptococcus suis]
MLIDPDKEQALKNFVQSCLILEEILVDTHLSQTNSSYYVTIFRPPNNFTLVRFSNHPPVKNYQDFVKIYYPDFDEAYYRNYISQIASRRKVHYSHYVVLKMVSLLKKYRITLKVDDSYDTFKNESLPPIFFALLNPSEKRKDIIHISESFNNILRALYKHGFVDIRYPKIGGTDVYITSSGRAVLETLDQRYQPYWQSDAKRIKWHFLNIPATVFFNSNKLAKVEQLERQRLRRQIDLRNERESRNWWQKLRDRFLLLMGFAKEYPEPEPIIMPKPVIPQSADSRTKSFQTSTKPKIATPSKKMSKQEDRQRSQQQLQAAINKRHNMSLDDDMINKLNQFKAGLEE